MRLGGAGCNIVKFERLFAWRFNVLITLPTSFITLKEDNEGTEESDDIFEAMRDTCDMIRRARRV